MLKKIDFMSPTGVAVWPKLGQPDTKFNPDGGDFTISVQLSAEEAAPLIEQFEKYREAAVADYRKDGKIKQKARVKAGSLPIKPETDKEGAETGNFLFSAKMKHIVRPRNGEPFKQRPKVFDSQGKLMPPDIGGGSRVKVAADIFPYLLSGAVGVTARLKAVQVLEFKASGQSFAGFGFSKENEGFVSDEEFVMGAEDSNFGVAPGDSVVAEGEGQSADF